MVGCRAADNGFGLAKSSVHVLEALQKAGQGTGADGDEAADLDVALSQFARYDTITFLCSRVFNPKKVVGQQIGKAAMNLANPFLLESAPAFESPAINPLLHLDMRLCFKL